MVLRFRRSIKVFPGVHVNIGKRGISTSFGVRGAHITVSDRGTRTTLGMPGTGLSATHYEAREDHQRSHPLTPEEIASERRSDAIIGWVVILAVPFAIYLVYRIASYFVAQ